MKRKNKDLIVHVVLDRSGSMASVKDDTIGAFNNYVEELAKTNPEAKLSLTIFDSQSVDTIVNNVSIKEVTPLNGTTYQPRGSTPLYDAVGKVIDKLENTKGKNKVLVVLTDGYENCSKEYSREGIKNSLDEKQEKNNWLVIYLGANQDAFAEGAKFGTQHINTMDFNTANMRSTLSATAAATSRYAATGSRLKAGFTAEEREAAQ
jgi:uncharacterized protein YegL